MQPFDDRFRTFPLGNSDCLGLFESTGLPIVDLVARGAAALFPLHRHRSFAGVLQLGELGRSEIGDGLGRGSLGGVIAGIRPNTIPITLPAAVGAVHVSGIRWNSVCVGDGLCWGNLPEKTL